MKSIGKIHSTTDRGRHITLSVDIKKEEWKAFDVSKPISIVQENHGGEENGSKK